MYEGMLTPGTRIHIRRQICRVLILFIYCTLFFKALSGTPPWVYNKTTKKYRMFYGKILGRGSQI